MINSIDELLSFGLKLIFHIIAFQLDPESEDDWPPPWLGYVLAVALFLVSMVQTMVLQQYWKRTYQVLR